MSNIHCRDHGEQNRTFVCQHIVQSLKDGVPYGFWWAAKDEQDRPDAWCTLCEGLVSKAGGEWTESVLKVAQVKVLCAKCYDVAKDLNIKN